MTADLFDAVSLAMHECARDWVHGPTLGVREVYPGHATPAEGRVCPTCGKVQASLLPKDDRTNIRDLCFENCDWVITVAYKNDKYGPTEHWATYGITGNRIALWAD